MYKQFMLLPLQLPMMACSSATYRQLNWYRPKPQRRVACPVSCKQPINVAAAAATCCLRCMQRNLLMRLLSWLQKIVCHMQHCCCRTHSSSSFGGSIRPCKLLATAATCCCCCCQRVLHIYWALISCACPLQPKWGVKWQCQPPPSPLHVACCMLLPLRAMTLTQLARIKVKERSQSQSDRVAPAVKLNSPPQTADNNSNTQQQQQQQQHQHSDNMQHMQRSASCLSLRPVLAPPKRLFQSGLRLKCCCCCCCWSCCCCCWSCCCCTPAWHHKNVKALFASLFVAVAVVAVVAGRLIGVSLPATRA